MKLILLLFPLFLIGLYAESQASKEERLHYYLGK
ncbi:hypothetical protein Fluta_1000 [Fluviicola taffensis DSM 16823]|uniref:Uncharacterized protein n=1 Tax=Fluviicola taffensis (strain DSM 16823 / NCIMB 13979 / RW262) TaxID=755732 RepID=F2I952_FLUTR|nr:hypothetical protein Fluta_1000 [Fluviicola taffensis DSM 16823]